MEMNYRKSSQFLMPAEKEKENIGEYGLYPTHSLGEGKIQLGFESLAAELQKHKTIIIDGYQGVFYENIREKLDAFFQKASVKTNWINVSEYLKPEAEID